MEYFSATELAALKSSINPLRQTVRFHVIRTQSEARMALEQKAMQMRQLETNHLTAAMDKRAAGRSATARHAPPSSGPAPQELPRTSKPE